MITQYHKIAVVATFGLALAFIFSCSSGDSPGDNSPGDNNSGSNGGSNTNNLCGSVSYDPSNYRCESGELIGKCRGEDYYVAYERCVDGVVVDNSSIVCTAADNNNIQYCSNGTMKQYGSMTDDGGRTYKTVVIGTQTWMAQNLNYNASDSKCGNGGSLSNENTTTCDKYGRLYNWATAKSVCPSGWHLPNDAEWTTLINSVGSLSIAGTKLKAKSGWYDDGNGTDDYGFSALPGGRGYAAGDFNNLGSYGNWWSATEGNAYNGDHWYMGYNDAGMSSNFLSSGYYGDKSYLYSVRCVQN